MGENPWPLLFFCTQQLSKTYGPCPVRSAVFKSRTSKEDFSPREEVLHERMMGGAVAASSEIKNT